MAPTNTEDRPVAELEEVHAFWSGREVRIFRGPHAGKLGYCYGPCACYCYDVSLPDTGEMIVLEEGDFGLPEDAAPLPQEPAAP